ncbi:unnamed protein product [Rotaria socialis]|uniref:Uncharacterized protein n=1 Tax=Rotaria socialis TaxID=392032 RepID=A0A818JWN4_9BILA|nr:unnamed protein product [Rotaria socialis]
MLSQFYFHNKFGTTNRTTTLAGDVQTQFTGINKQPRYLSKAVHDQSVNAICARFKIDPDYFTEFFRTCLRRTLPQTICDVRRTRRRSAVRVIAGGNVDGNRGNGYFGNIGVANAAASPFQSTSHSLTGDDP